jgi:hypothetical protein
MADSDKRSMVLPRYSRRNLVVIEDTGHMWEAVDKQIYSVGMVQDREVSVDDATLKPLAAAEGSNESARHMLQPGRKLEGWGEGYLPLETVLRKRCLCLAKSRKTEGYCLLTLGQRRCRRCNFCGLLSHNNLSSSKNDTSPLELPLHSSIPNDFDTLCLLYDSDQ